MSTATLLVLHSSQQRKTKDSDDKLSSLQIGLIVGLTVGIPVFLILCCYLVNYCVHVARKRQFAKARDRALAQALAQPQTSIIALTMCTGKDELSKHFPDEVLRKKLEQGIFHDDVLQAFGNLSKESRDYIVSWMKQRHGPSKANELPLIALDP